MFLRLGTREGPSHGQKASDNPEELSGVEFAQDTLASYRERRGNHGMYIAFSYEALDLKNYISTLDFKSYEEMFGTEAIPLVGVNLDYKYNFVLGSLALGVNFASGSISDDLSRTKRTLDITKYGATLKYVAGCSV